MADYDLSSDEVVVLSIIEKANNAEEGRININLSKKDIVNILRSPNNFSNAMKAATHARVDLAVDMLVLEGMIIIHGGPYRAQRVYKITDQGKEWDAYYKDEGSAAFN